jgi:nucleotide-binding universal stress UspA family protein
MMKKILVPLDGSKLAECALPYAQEIAAGNNKEIVLVSVTERIQALRPMEDPTQPMEQRLVPEAIGKMERQARNYLNKQVKALTVKGIKARADVLLGRPAEEIINYVKYNEIDLIVMSSHGRSGPSRWAYGSVTEKVFRSSSVPILVVKAPGCIPGL